MLVVKNASSRRKYFLRLIPLAAAALAISTFFCACDRTDQKPTGPPEKITIAYSATPDAVLAEVAQANGYFLQEGLDVTPLLHAYGKLALDDLLAEKADIATVAETPIMFAIMQGGKIAVIATIQTSNTGNAILARRDKGILTLGDLKGKKIAATLNTTSDFFLDTILSINRISRKDIEIVNMKAHEMADALADGDIDAASSCPSYTAMTRRKMDNLAIIFQDEDIYRWTFNVVASQEFIKKKPGTVKKILRALVKAEEFVKDNPADAQKIVSDFCAMEISVVRDVWSNSSFAATIDQALLLSLEDESRWAINTGLTEARKIPNYLEYIYLDGLTVVKPDAVRIVK